LRYEDIKVGTGPLGEAGKLWHIKYTGWRAADGIKFDSWEDHGQPVMGKDGKPELGPDGKPKLGDPQPMAVQQGVGRVIPGFDYGLDGMRVGGKRRIFIPWQEAYGTRAIPDRPEHPGIPAKSDLIFDVELVDVTDAPTPQRATMPFQRPGVPPATAPVHPGPGVPPQPGASAQPNAAPATPPVSAPAQPSTPAQPQAPAQPTAPAQPATPQQPSTPAPPATSTPAQPQPK
jgi:peptidylprolyl isomerase